MFVVLSGPIEIAGDILLPSTH